jgi:hypothetical protein
VLLLYRPNSSEKSAACMGLTDRRSARRQGIRPRCDEESGAY